jgi:hypothetical protein
MHDEGSKVSFFSDLVTESFVEGHLCTQLCCRAVAPTKANIFPELMEQSYKHSSYSCSSWSMTVIPRYSS